MLLKNQITQVRYKVMSLLLHVAKLAPRAEAVSLACDGQGPSPQRGSSKGPALLLVECNSSGVLFKQRSVLTATPGLAAIQECHSGKTAADDNDILFFLLSYHTVPCTPFSACLLGGPAPSIISFLQNLQSFLPHWYLPLALPADMHKSLLLEKKREPAWPCGPLLSPQSLCILCPSFLSQPPATCFLLSSYCVAHPSSSSPSPSNNTLTFPWGSPPTFRPSRLGKR